MFNKLIFGTTLILSVQVLALDPIITDSTNPTSKDIGLYARIVMPLNAPKERINCNTLYKLELRKKRLEVMRLEQELADLRRLGIKNKFEN